MDEFRRKPINKAPASRPVGPSVPAPQARTRPVLPVTPPTEAQPQPIEQQPLTTDTGLATNVKKKSRKKILIWSLIGFFVALLLTIGGIFLWYTLQLAPVNSSKTDKQLVVIESGSTPTDIANLLKEKELIRNPTAFLWYSRLEGVQNLLQAGTYRLSPSESTPQIVEHLSSGRVDTFSITFLPGATLADNRKVLIGAGYDASAVDAALAKTYDSPLFAGKPTSADLEGYIYGETYSFGTDTSVEAILEHVFDEFYSVVEKNNLVAKFKAQDLTLYEGITLASIVQREASPKADDMPQIAQVFYSRLAMDMPLGSDVTYQYIADKTGVARDPNLDSPYNTRRYAGLPPGPISSPGEKALVAVANPASGDYLYFLSGDDDITYFGRTLEEHEANITNHCQEKCKIL
jgi:UPF0755 protein